MRFKNREGYVTDQNKQYLLAVDFNCYNNNDFIDVRVQRVHIFVARSFRIQNVTSSHFVTGTTLALHHENETAYTLQNDANFMLEITAPS